MDYTEALKLPIFDSLREKCEVKSDNAWHKAIYIDGFTDGEDALKVAYTKLLKLTNQLDFIHLYILEARAENLLETNFQCQHVYCLEKGQITIYGKTKSTEKSAHHAHSCKLQKYIFEV